jgi:hypothetical protein
MLKIVCGSFGAFDSRTVTFAPLLEGFGERDVDHRLLGHSVLP